MDKKAPQARVKQVTEGGWGGDAVVQAVTAVQAAVVAAVVVPVVVSAGN